MTVNTLSLTQSQVWKFLLPLPSGCSPPPPPVAIITCKGSCGAKSSPSLVVPPRLANKSAAPYESLPPNAGGFGVVSELSFLPNLSGFGVNSPSPRGAKSFFGGLVGTASLSLFLLRPAEPGGLRGVAGVVMIGILESGDLGEVFEEAEPVVLMVRSSGSFDEEAEKPGVGDERPLPPFLFPFLFFFGAIFEFSKFLFSPPR